MAFTCTDLQVQNLAVECFECLCFGLSLAWCLRNEGVSCVLLGASSTDQLMENIGAIQVRH